MKAELNTRQIKPPYDSMTLRAIVAELRAELIGGQVQDIRQPVPADLQIGIRSRGRNYLLLLSADARFARAYLTTERRPNAIKPPTFCMTLRKHMEGGCIRDVRQIGFDRILEIDVSACSESNAPAVTLVAELMGKHSNLVLVNAEGTVLEAAKRISHRINRVRETLPGVAYQPPPDQPDRVDPFQAGAVEKIVRELPLLPQDRPQSLADVLMQVFAGLSPFLAREIAARAGTDPTGMEAGLRQAWEDLFGGALRESYAPVLVWDTTGAPLGAYPFPLVQVVQVSPERQQRVPSLNLALDETFKVQIGKTQFEEVYNDLRGRIDRELQWLDRQQKALLRALEEAAKAESQKQSGELILANLWRMQPGEAQIEVEDYYDPELKPRVIELDPMRDPQQNAELYFQRYRKARASEEKEKERQMKTAADLLKVRSAREELDRLTLPEAVQSLRNTLMQNGLLRPTEEQGVAAGREAGPDFQGHKIRRYTTPEGYEIYLGETATANDFLTTRIASPNDLWLHVRAAASAHVVIRSKGSPDLTPRTVIQRAAELCALHSAQKHSSLVSVDYTLKKYVRKPRGSAPGAADYSKEITIDVSPEIN